MLEGPWRLRRSAVGRCSCHPQPHLLRRVRHGHDLHEHGLGRPHAVRAADDLRGTRAAAAAGMRGARLDLVDARGRPTRAEPAGAAPPPTPSPPPSTAQRSRHSTQRACCSTAASARGSMRYTRLTKDRSRPSAPVSSISSTWGRGGGGGLRGRWGEEPGGGSAARKGLGASRCEARERMRAACPPARSPPGALTPMVGSRLKRATTACFSCGGVLCSSDTKRSCAGRRRGRGRGGGGGAGRRRQWWGGRRNRNGSICEAPGRPATGRAHLARRELPLQQLEVHPELGEDNRLGLHRAAAALEDAARGLARPPQRRAVPRLALARRRRHDRARVQQAPQQVLDLGFWGR
jgi:hypothetical protein